MTEYLAPEVERLLAAGEAVVVATVVEARGSTPRAAGARMAVAATTIIGTIGGGNLEWEVVQRARDMIASGGSSDLLDVPLGPAMGQCCGGHVVLRLERADAAAASALAQAEAREELEAPQLAIFGAGHVGKALVRACAPLPLRILWADTRREEFPAGVAESIEVDHADPVETVRRAEPDAAVVVVTHNHALDFAITEAALRRTDLAYVGLIGSRTKRRRFERWFTARGGDAAALANLVSPIGEFGVSDKRPAVIAALVAAEVLRALAPRGRLGDGRAAQQEREDAI
ncbi:MAG: xanthine dehydrogenase accessory protein XdhC [Rhodospirillales bacterium]|nr:xanthine dehydrogenase accessory protein XdhC [Rhodospirillales bacterium]